MIEFELDIPSLTDEGIQTSNEYRYVNELSSKSMSNELLISRC